MTTGEDPRHRLLDVAGQKFAEKGFDATNVREITEAAGMNVASVNYHFGSKEELYIEAVRHAARTCEPITPMPTWPEGVPAEQRLRDFIRAFLTRLLREDCPGLAPAADHARGRRPAAGRLRGVRAGLRQADVRDAARHPARTHARRRRRGVAAPDGREHRRPVPALPPRPAHHAAARRPGRVRRSTVERLTDHICAVLAGGGPRHVRQAEARGPAMNWIALKMLTGDRAKYLGIVFGVTFASLLMAQQASIFCGLMRRTTSQIQRRRRGRHLGHGPERPVHRRHQAAVRQRPVPRPRRAGRGLGGAALQGPGPGAARRRQLPAGDPPRPGRRHAGRRAARDGRWAASPTCASPTR